MTSAELRELDAWIAEHVMGLEVQADQVCKPGPWFEKPVRRADDPVDYFVGKSDERVPSYSTDIAAAWQVVEKVRSRARPHFQLGLCDAYSDQVRWYAEFDLDRPLKRVLEKATTAPLAICLAAKAAFEGKP